MRGTAERSGDEATDRERVGPVPTRGRQALRTRLAAILMSVVLVGGLAPSGDAGATESARAGYSAGRYVVVLREPPIIASSGTRFEPGRDAPGLASAERLILDAQARLMVNSGVATASVTHRYTHSLNGFAAELSAVQAERLAASGDVWMLLPDVLRQPHSVPLARSGRLGAATGAGADGRVPPEIDGRGVVIGVIDSGIWPEHPSFADDGSHPAPPITLDGSERSACAFGNSAHNAADEPFDCNNKLIGARQMLDTYRAVLGVEIDEYDSARDDDGHGTHTASIAAGNDGVTADVLGIPRGEISGVAPGAHIVAYKALGNRGGYTSDLAAAIDQAVADGVDVINYSIGSGAGGPGADDIAFLFAVDAGVHVVTSAGNDGPEGGTVGNPGSMPWLLTVGAAVGPTQYQGIVHLGNRQKLVGASITGGSDGRFELVDAAHAGGDLCLPGDLDEDLVRGRIVLCRRGGIARTLKSRAVADAGGVGMVLYNVTSDQDRYTDTHLIPTVHLDMSDGLAVKEYIEMNRQPPTARLFGGNTVEVENASTVTAFSSRGPNADADVIKPDLVAAGHQVLAGYSPTPDPDTSAPGELFSALSGTSMSSPHVAGLAALLHQVHPNWSPAAVKSALMTTADPEMTSHDAATPTSPFDVGSGLVDRGGSIDPGIVYDAGFIDYLGWLCGAHRSVFADADTTCGTLEEGGVSTDPSDLNYPSIAVAALAGTQTLTRTLTNVGDRYETYRAVVDAPPGYRVDVMPRRVELAPDDSLPVTITITAVKTNLDAWSFGSLTWRGDGRVVRSPIAVRSVALGAPDEVRGTGSDGAVTIPVDFGYTGAYRATAHGLQPATPTVGTVAQDPDQIFDPTDVAAGGAAKVSVRVEAASLLRVSLPVEAVPADADLDLYLYDADGNRLARSTSNGRDEQIDLVAPADGTYDVYVHGWTVPEAPAAFTLSTWTIGDAEAGNLQVTTQPERGEVGTTSNVVTSWTDASEGGWHLGAVTHHGPKGPIGVTLVEVDNR